MTKSKNLHLSISVIIITVISLTYGLLPTTILPKLFDFNVGSTDLKHVFRATMGLYLGMAVFWAIGILKPLHWRSATFSNMFFMIGLAAGRIISLVVDGFPSITFLAGLALELTLGLWAISNLKKYSPAANQ